MIVARGLGIGSGSTIVTTGYGLDGFVPPVVPPSSSAPRPTLRPMRPRSEEDELIVLVTAALHVIYSQ